MSEGLNTLFGVKKPKENESNLKEIDINLIKPNKDQPRTHFDQNALEELSNSIKENGILQPLVVVKTSEGYELIAGERRLRASKLANLSKVPVVVKEATDKQKSILAIIENLQREDLNPIELATSYKKAMNDYELTQDELAKKLGKARSSIANVLRLLTLPREVKEIAKENSNKVTSGHLKILASIKDEEKAIDLAKEVVENSLTVQKLRSLSSEKKTKAVIQKSQNPLVSDLESLCSMKLVKGKGSLSLKFNSYEELLEKLKEIKTRIKKEMDDE